MRISSPLKIGIISFFLITFFLVLNLTEFSQKIKNFFYLISSPVQKTLWQAGDNVSDFFGGIFQARDLIKEQEQLKSKIKKLTAQNFALSDLEKENKILRKALNIGLEKEFKLTFSNVIGKDISQDFILIDKGKKDGLQAGFPVITEEKILCGKISQVYSDFSKVMLPSHREISFDVKLLFPNFSNQAEINNKIGEIKGLLQGKGRLSAIVDFLPLEKEISLGQIVVTDVLGGIFPENLLVGEIKKVQKSDIEPWQTAQIKPYCDLKKIKNLFIINERRIEE